MARASRRLYALALLASLTACTDSAYRVRVTFDEPVDPASVAFVELLLLPNCPANVASGEPPGGTALARLGLDRDDAESLPAFGQLDSGAYGLYARGFDASCIAIAAGCAEVVLEEGGEGTLLVALAETPAIPACDAGASCVDGQCIEPQLDSGVPQTATCTLEPTADGFASTYLAEPPSGTDVTMSTFDGDGVAEMYAFVAFDLAAQCQESGTIPEGATVTAATLTLTLESECSLCDHDHEIHVVTAPWTEGSFSGTETGPAVAATASTTFVAPSSGPVSATGLASDVQSFLADPASNHGWRIRQVPNVGGSATSPFGWATREAAAGARPRLVVTYEVP